MPHSDELLDLARGAAARAASELAERARRRTEPLATKSSPTDLVTEADRATEQLIIEILLDARPDDAILGEEAGRRAGSSGVEWVIDPLDGTTNFVYGYPQFAVSIAARLDGTTVAGVVADPSSGEEYRATLGGGAWRGDERLGVRDSHDLATALVGTGFSYDPERRRLQARALETILPAVRDIRRAGSAALDLCWVAGGRLDAYWERGLAEWDHAAGALVALEAGAVVELLDDDPLLLAATPELFAAMADLLRRAGA
jgi:myo-inositol-1(or 4)-monophosphatase